MAEDGSLDLDLIDWLLGRQAHLPFLFAKSPFLCYFLEDEIPNQIYRCCFFDISGYKFNEKMSDGDNFSFCR